MAGMAYCLVFKHKDYERANEMINLIAESIATGNPVHGGHVHSKDCSHGVQEPLPPLSEFYQGLIAAATKEIADKGSAGVPTSLADTNTTIEATAEANNFEKPAISDEEWQLITKLEADSKDIESRFALAKLLFEKGKSEEAIEHCLVMLKQNKAWNDRAAYTLLISIFDKLGKGSEVVNVARKKLAKILF